MKYPLRPCLRQTANFEACGPGFILTKPIRISIVYGVSVFSTFVYTKGESMPDRVIPVRIPENLFELMEAIRKRRNARSKGDHLTRSAWLREAVREKINHVTRSQKKNVKNTFLCTICKLAKPLVELDAVMHLLGSGKEYRCKGCTYTKPLSTKPPVLDHGQTSPAADSEPGS